MQEHIIFAANLLHAIPVALGRDDDAAASGDRFEAERADGIGAFAEDGVFDRLRRLFAIGVARPAVLCAVFEAVRNLHEARGEGAVLCVAFLLAASGEGGDGGAVIVALAVEDFVLLATVMLVRNLAHHLEGFLVRFGAGVRVVDAAEARHLLDQALGEFGAGDRAFGACEIAHLDELVADGVSDFGAAIADVDCPDAAGHRINMFLAGHIPNAQAAAFDDDLGVDGFERFVLDEMVPDMRAIGLDDLSGVVGKRKGFHGDLQ